MISENPGSHVFQQTRTIFIHIQDIIQTNILTKTNAPHPGGHVFQATGTIFELVRDIIGTNLLTKFHDDRTIYVASRVLAWFYYSYIRKNVTTPWIVYKSTKTIFELIQDIIGKILLTKFHEDRKINVASRVLTRKNALPPGGHVFQQPASFLNSSEINVASKVKNALPLGSHVFQANKFHEDWTIHVAFTVLTRQLLTPHDGRRTKGDHKSSP
ncbi:hypothetical protein DPMN_051573 [Dreissena polymorpha]|uniref:Uncharacterized protein n=1 Tax=Dreissena polymorpha TaxID=45954 RepID=A0A9D4HNG1_DREPO|nr:hypothetical protein DPMN_051573 [Dreissena polymorpha]